MAFESLAGSAAYVKKYLKKITSIFQGIAYEKNACLQTKE